MSDFFTENAAFLLGREPREVIGAKTMEYMRGKRVLITGGGGSIGSELCMCAARCGVGHLIILDINENNAHDVCERLAYAYPHIHVSVEIASVRDRERIRRVFCKYRPQLVLHAAAHKHVPMMENNPAEAVKNNIFGTVNTADAAEEYSAERFVLISTDKAVEPTSVMGATKRFCEYIISSRAESKTSFAAVRFGNVLGSAGSAAPSFLRAIEFGGEICITDERAERYFMTIPEAAGLVLCAASVGGSGIYVLDMGEPVKIVELARRIGDVLGKPVNMRITELGVGEKLTERLFYAEAVPTENERILYEPQPIYCRERIAASLESFFAACGDDDSARDALRTAVIEYK